MIYRLLLITLLLSAHCLRAHAEPLEDPLKEAYALLSQSKTGSEAIAQALSLKVPVFLGKVSRTDITATRVVQGTREDLKFQTQVIVAEDKEPVFQALDLAHELVHATHQKGNPFDPNLDLAAYVKHGIEGEGGEAEAIAQECKVGQELIDGKVKSQLKAETVQLITARCQFVWKTVVNESRWKQSFYYLGQHYRDFMSGLTKLHLSEEKRNAWFNKVEARSPMFASAVAHKPYPLALLEEYVDITTKICERSKASQVGRNLASASVLTERCNSIGVSLNP